MGKLSDGSFRRLCVNINSVVYKKLKEEFDVILFMFLVLRSLADKMLFCCWVFQFTRINWCI